MDYSESRRPHRRSGSVLPYEVSTRCRATGTRPHPRDRHGLNPCAHLGPGPSYHRPVPPHATVERGELGGSSQRAPCFTALGQRLRHRHCGPACSFGGAGVSPWTAEPPPGWEDRGMARWHPGIRRFRKWGMAGAGSNCDAGASHYA